MLEKIKENPLETAGIIAIWLLMAAQVGRYLLWG